MKIFRIIAAAVVLAASPALAQFPAAAEQPGGPVAVGQAQAQVDPGTNRIAIVQAPTPPDQKAGGIVHLSAFGWLTPYADTIAQALIALGAAWFAKSKYSAMMDESSRTALETFLKNRASSLLADGAVRMQDKAIHVDNAFLYRAATQASSAIPDALKRFGLTPDVVAAKIIDAIPQVQAGAAMIATAHAEDPGAAPVPVADRAPEPPVPVAPEPLRGLSFDGSKFPPTSSIA